MRKRGTKLYFGGRGRWVTRDALALRFETVEEALLFNRREHLQDMEVVIAHSDQQHKRVLPITGATWTNPQWIRAGQTGG